MLSRYSSACLAQARRSLVSVIHELQQALGLSPSIGPRDGMSRRDNHEAPISFADNASDCTTEWRRAMLSLLTVWRMEWIECTPAIKAHSRAVSLALVKDTLMWRVLHDLHRRRPSDFRA